MLRRNYFLIFVLVLTGVLFLPHSSHLQSIPPDLPDPPVLDQAALDAASARGVPKNYYVDSIDGDDFNIGTIAWPWKTLQKVYDRSPSFAPGTNIFLKRGCTWNEPLRLQCDGDPTKNPYQYIVIRDYGYGDKPKINGDGNGFDCAVYLDRNFIYLRNLSITYINQGFAQGGTVGKGIRIAPTTRPDLETQENNIWLDQCDVSNCPLDGILIFQRGHITVSGNQNNTPPPFAIERSLITPTLSLLLLSDDPSGDNLQSPMVSEPTEAIFPPPPPDLTTDRPIRHAVKHPLSPVFQHSPQDMSPPPALLASPPPPAEPLDPTLIPPPPPVVLPKYTPGVTDTPGLTASANTVTPLADADILQKSDISFNGTVGITVLSRYEGSFVDCNDITIDYCYIHHNNQHGVYLEGSNAIIKNNLMQYNGNQRDQHGNP
ncbi:MAG: right-handed parallel beta-helix repeat-containing protein, partial [Thermodesulfobacteriota bacterium]